MANIVELTRAGSGSKCMVNADYIVTIERNEYDGMDDFVECTKITMTTGKGLAVEEDVRHIAEKINRRALDFA